MEKNWKIFQMKSKAYHDPSFQLGMDRIAVLRDIRPTGYPAILKTGYRISGRISGGCRIPEIRPIPTNYYHIKAEGTLFFNLIMLHDLIPLHLNYNIKD